MSTLFDNPCVHAHETCFSNPPIHQVVFYQSGIGTDNLYDKIVDGEVSFNIVWQAGRTDDEWLGSSGVTGANLGG